MSLRMTVSEAVAAVEEGKDWRTRRSSRHRGMEASESAVVGNSVDGVQGDHSGCVKPPVDTKTKVPL